MSELKENKVTTKPNHDKLFKELCNVIIRNLGVTEDAIKLEASITEDLKADSLDNVELIMDIEESFGITISEEESENLNTVGDFYNFVKSKKGNS